MTNADRAGSIPIEIFHDLLAPEELEQYAQHGTLPPVARARLRAHLGSLAAFLPAPLVQEQLADPCPGRVRGAFWDGSLLFADLSGFTALSSTFGALGKQGAEEVSAIINRLFSALADELHTHHGALLKFGGDAITAFFSAADLGSHHALLASQAALAMQRRMRAFASLSTRAGTFPLRLRIGVHSGRVFAAQVGDTSHIELVVTGRNVNRVARAQEIAEPGEVVISEITAAQLPQAMLEPCQAGFLRLRHLDAPPPPAPAPAPDWNGDGDELEGLARRIAALRPYLPYGLPRRFVEDGESTSESGEFRPVTVLFANFFPFSEMLELLGEDAGTAVAVLNAYYRRAQEVLHRYGGIVNKIDLATNGDKLMALFGAPVAREDDPERAVRAALELQPALDEANREIAALLAGAISARDLPEAQRELLAGLRQRIGLNTGVVFAGRVGSAHRHEYTVMGQHVNLAARLMAAAEVDTVILSPSTRKVVAHQFALRELPPVALKGIPEPVPLAQALHPREVAQSVPRSLGQATLVGREKELGTLLSEARAAFHGRGRVVVLVGEAGCGKSRLIADALHALILRSASATPDLPPFFTFSVECQSYEQSTPYALVRELLRQFFTHPDSLDAISQRVNQLVPELLRFAPLLGDLLGTPFPDTALTAALSPEQRHDRAQELVEALFLAHAQRQPLLLICDDLQWVDASSLELLGRLARQARHAALLLLLGYRADPPIPEPWADLAHCTRLPLRELAPSETAALVGALLHSAPPPALLTLVEKTQGNPFFVEEVIHSLIESGVLAREEGTWRLTRPLEETLVPDSIEGVITARLDRLEERSREVLQVAAVVGRRFPYPILAGIVNQRDSLLDLLGQLSEADLILAEQIERDLAYLFKHALTRDVAYEAILYARRRELHRRVAGQIEVLHAGRLDEQLALLARHYLLAEDWPRAFDFHLRAGRLAQARFANREAITLYEDALSIVPHLSSDNESPEPAPAHEDGSRSSPALSEVEGVLGSRFSVLGSQIIELHERLGWVYALIGEYDKALKYYHAGLAMIRSLPDAPIDDLVRPHRHIAEVHQKRSSFETALEWIDQAITLSGEISSLELARCLLLGAGLHQRQGRYPLALELGGRALDMAEQFGSRRDQAYAFLLLGGTYRNLGDNLRAFEFNSRSLQLYEQVQELARVADAHNNLALTCQDLGQLGQAREHFEAGAAIKQATGDIYGEGLLTNNLGNLFLLQGKPDEAIAQFKRGLDIFERIGSPYVTAVLHMNLGAAQLLSGHLDTAQQSLDQSAALFKQAGAEDFLPELKRYYAKLALAEGRLQDALAYADESLDLAQRLDARAEAGATQHIRGLILNRSGRRSEALAALRQACAIFTEIGNNHELADCLEDLERIAKDNEPLAINA